MTLRTRFAWIFGASIAAAMLFVAAASALTLSGALRSSLDARLLTTAHAVAALVDVRRGRPGLDAEDRRQVDVLLGTTMHGAIVDTRGKTLIAFQRGVLPADAGASPAATDSVEDATAGEEGRVASVSIRSGSSRVGTAIVWGSNDDISGWVRNALVATFLMSLLAGAAAVAISWLVAARALAPLEHMSMIAEEIEARDLSRRLNIGTADESGRLARAFDRMLQRLQAAFDRQKRFTADASHELRAPLAVIRAEADVTLERDRDGETYRRALAVIGKEVERADAVISSLLAMARAEDQPPRRASCELSDIAQRVLHRFGPEMRRRKVHSETAFSRVVVQADEAGIDRALSAVLHNAVDAARSRVVVIVSQNGEGGVVDIRDDGPGFTGQALENATVRFWRDGPERGRERNGLGLAIATSIVQAHGGTLRLWNQPASGAAVTIVLPFIAPSS